MTAGSTADRDGTDVEALIADRYLEALLAAGDRHAEDAPADAVLEADVRRAAAVLRRSLVRVHPSFRFEERLAGRLAGLAAVRAAGATSPAHDDEGAAGIDPAWPAPAGELVTFPVTPVGAEDPLLAPILAGELDPADDTVLDLDGPFASRRPLLVGGAITSAAISLVGVAWVAWRATRPAGRDGGPAAGGMPRAARAAHARRVPPVLSGRFGGLS